MEIEIFTMCDSAQNYQEKLVIVGTFHTIQSTMIPFTHDSFSIACGIRLDKTDTGSNYEFEIRFLRDDGTKFIPTDVKGKLTPADNQKDAAYRMINFVVNARSVEFTSGGMHYIELLINGKSLKRYPFEITVR